MACLYGIKTLTLDMLSGIHMYKSGFAGNATTNLPRIKDLFSPQTNFGNTFSSSLDIR
jgi:hypothetical protein